MSESLPAWSIRSILISVRDLDRSVAFYQDVMDVHEVLRESEIAVLAGDAGGTLTLYLRAAPRHATMSGQQSLGMRAVTYNVGSNAELERVEARLQAHDLFRDRGRLEADGTVVELVRGHDPDRLPLNFVAYETPLTMTSAAYANVVLSMYTLDL